MKRRLVWAVAGVAAIASLAAAAFYLYAGLYGFNVLLKRGGSVWVAITPTDSRISSSMQKALQVPPPGAQAGALTWVQHRPGFETAELPVIAAGVEVDRILLTRIDPIGHRFAVFSRPAGDYDLGDWMQHLGAALVVNGSYYARDGRPDTPVLVAGTALGPLNYTARHGAFVASAARTAIEDLDRQDWRTVFQTADDGVVSYPLLVGPGPSRVKADSRWLANRSFVGEDSSGRIIIGTTQDAFFSLERFADFLRQAPLGLVHALNLDGGPVACQGVAMGTATRDFCGMWETKFEDNTIKLLQPIFGKRRWGLPIVLAVFPR